MDQPKKSLATSSRRDMIFTDLPDHIVHHILSYLAIVDLARFSVASTRCRELCRSVPSLVIDNKKYSNVLHSRFEGFANFVDRFLGLRFKLGPEIRRFCLRWSFKHPSAEKYRLETWLYYAFYSNVEELDLEIIPQSEQLGTLAFSFALPVSVSFDSLRSLKVNMHKAGILKLPTFVFTALQTLSLKSVRIEQESFGEWVSTCCKSLRELYLEDLCGVVKSINIMSSSLEILMIDFKPSKIICHIKISAPKLQTLFMIWYSFSSSIKSLIVTAPNLKWLMWVGYLNYHYRVEKFLRLQKASIFLSWPPPNYRENEVCKGLNLSEIVGSVSKAKTLYLGGEFVEILYMRGCLPFSTDDLRKLAIERLNGTIVPAIASLLKGTPDLEVLAIVPRKLPNNNNNGGPSNLPSEEIGFSMEYWESQNLRFTDQLKMAAITVCGGQNELELLKYLLKHAKELKRMDIYCPHPLPSRISKELNELKNSFSAVRLYNGVLSVINLFKII